MKREQKLYRIPGCKTGHKMGTMCVRWGYKVCSSFIYRALHRESDKWKPEGTFLVLPQMPVFVWHLVAAKVAEN